MLGRDFIINYDVVIDLIRRRLTMANKDGNYQLRPLLKEKRPACQHRALVAEKIKIEPETINLVKCQVRPKRKALDRDGISRNGDWMALADGEKGNLFQNKGIAAPRALVMVRDGEVQLPLLNVRQKGGSDARIPPEFGNLVIRPVQRVYERVL